MPADRGPMEIRECRLIHAISESNFQVIRGYPALRDRVPAHLCRAGGESGVVQEACLPGRNPLHEARSGPLRLVAKRLLACKNGVFTLQSSSPPVWHWPYREREPV